jgi:hypothetical protein
MGWLIKITLWNASPGSGAINSAEDGVAQDSYFLYYYGSDVTLCLQHGFVLSKHYGHADFHAEADGFLT